MFVAAFRVRSLVSANAVLLVPDRRTTGDSNKEHRYGGKHQLDPLSLDCLLPSGLGCRGIKLDSTESLLHRCQVVLDRIRHLAGIFGAVTGVELHAPTTEFAKLRIESL